MKGWRYESYRHSLAARGIKTRLSFTTRFHTEDEKLFYKVKFNKLLQIIDEPDVLVLEYSRSTNSYGNFLFIKLYDKKENEIITYYGLGIHEFRNRYIVDDFTYYSTSNVIRSDEKEQIVHPKDKEALKKLLVSEHERYSKLSKAHKLVPDKEFEALADVSDDDAAISIRDDMGVPRIKTWMGSVPKQDDYGQKIEDEFIDGKTKEGPWAMMTPVSFAINGVGLGTGKGQRYKKEGSRWIKIEG
jgi:hypothetical protein